MDKTSDRLSIVTGQRKKLKKRVEDLVSENKSLEGEVKSLKQQISSTEEYYEQKKILLEKELEDLTRRLAKNTESFVEENDINKCEERRKNKVHLKQDAVKSEEVKKKVLVLNISDLCPRQKEDNLHLRTGLKSSKLVFNLDENGSSRNREKWKTTKKIAELKNEIKLEITSAEMDKRRYLKKVEKLKEELQIEIVASNDEKRTTLACVEGTDQQKRNLSEKLADLYEKNRRLSVVWMDSKDEVQSLMTRVEDLMDDVKRLRNMLKKESSQNSQLAVIDSVSSVETREFIARSKAQQRALQANLTSLEKQNKRLEISIQDSKRRGDELQDKLKMIESKKVLLKASLNEMEKSKEALELKVEYLEGEQMRLLSRLHQDSQQYNSR